MLHALIFDARYIHLSLCNVVNALFLQSLGLFWQSELDWLMLGKVLVVIVNAELLADVLNGFLCEFDFLDFFDELRLNNGLGKDRCQELALCLFGNCPLVEIRLQCLRFCIFKLLGHHFLGIVLQIAKHVT